ncbi:MAG: hypothetical protein AB1750_09115, partial [Chloroflexota bacterium]
VRRCLRPVTVMRFILLFLDKNEIFFYLVLAFIGLIVFRRLWRNWKEWRESYYGFERELAVRRLAQTAAIAALILLVACGIFALGTFVVPNLPASALLSTPPVNLLATPQPGATGGAMALETASATAAPIPGSEGCVPGTLEITSPRPGEAVSGKVEIVGTVNVPGMGFYKYEFAPLGSDIWATISASRKPVLNGSLGAWFTGALTPGDYQLRLVATDSEGNALPACVITVRVIGT